LENEWTCHLQIHFAEVTIDVIKVLAIDILPLFSNRYNNHVHKIRTSALKEMLLSNLVDLFIGLNSKFKRDYGSKTRERKNNDTKDYSFADTRALLLVAKLSRWCICILPNRLVVPSCRKIIWIGRVRVIKDKSLK
jgi:hypothetical protein